MPTQTITTAPSTIPAWRRVCRVLADEGTAGMTRRVQSRLRPSGHSQVAATATHEERIRRFRQVASRLGEGDIGNYYWYHTIDLGNGIVTPGDYDYRSIVSVYQFPDDMRGMKVLDVGSATGFFAFEFERRGAEVVSVELPSISDWDMPQGPDREQTLKELMDAHQVTSVAELTRVHLHAPFELCHRVLGSKVERCLSRVYDLTPEKVGHRTFDMVFAGDILLHTFSPLMALAALAPLCSGRIIIAQHLPDMTPDKPVMLFSGASRDRRTWWHPNLACLEAMLRRVGFAHSQVVAEHTVAGRDGEWVIPNQAILHATR